MFLKICSTHLFKAILNQLKECHFNANAKKLLVKSTAKLICCENFYLFVKIGSALQIILTNRHVTDEVCNARKFLDLVSCKHSYNKLPTKLSREIYINQKELYLKSPFSHYFSCKAIPDSLIPTNECFSEQFSNYFFKKVIPYAPLWSSFVKERESNANVESYFKLIKKDLLNYSLKQKPGRVLQSLHSYVDSKLFELENELPKKPFSKKDILNIPEEKWKSPVTSSKFFSDDILSKYSFI